MRSLAAALAAAALGLTSAPPSPARAEQILIGLQPDGDDQFGRSVALSPNLAVVGAREYVAGPSAGHAYVYRFDSGTWALDQRLEVPGGCFGLSAAIAGDQVVVGAGSADLGCGDQARVRVYQHSGASWTLLQTLAPSDESANQIFGASLSASDDVLVIGAWGDPGGGAAYVLRWSGSAWVEDQKLTASDRTSGDGFGFSVELSGDVIVVGAPFDDGAAGSNQGSAYVFRFDGSGFVEEQKLLASSPGASQQFGRAVSATAGRVAVGTLSAAAAYVYADDGSSWAEETRLTGFPTSAFGSALALSGDALLVGARQAGNGGEAYLYRLIAGTWTLATTLVPTGPDGAPFYPGFSFGRTLAMVGDAMLVGAQGALSSTGRAYIYGGGSCGDGVLDDNEACDDANQDPGDGCSPQCVVEQCSNGGDDDGDGLADLADPGCNDAADLSELEAGLACDNGEDDDGDAYTDLFDPGCSGPADPSENEPGLPCDDGGDGDGDGYVDVADPGCQGPADESERSAALVCDNGLDDDGDGFVDSPSDPACTTPRRPSEQTQCQDGIDNDGQLGIDFDGGASRNGGVPLAVADPECAGSPGRNLEVRVGCGIGFELAPLFALFALGRPRGPRSPRR